jgi:hypothetical protein
MKLKHGIEDALKGKVWFLSNDYDKNLPDRLSVYGSNVIDENVLKTEISAFKIFTSYKHECGKFSVIKFSKEPEYGNVLDSGSDLILVQRDILLSRKKIDEELFNYFKSYFTQMENKAIRKEGFKIEKLIQFYENIKQGLENGHV